MVEEIKRAFLMVKNGGSPKGLLGFYSYCMEKWINAKSLTNVIGGWFSKPTVESLINGLIDSAIDSEFKNILKKKLFLSASADSPDEVATKFIESFKEAVERRNSLEKIVKKVGFPEKYIKLVIDMLRSMQISPINAGSCALNELINFKPKSSFLNEVGDNCLGPASLMELLIWSTIHSKNNDRINDGSLDRRKLMILVLLSILGYKKGRTASGYYLLIDEDLSRISLEDLENQLRRGIKSFIDHARSKFPGTVNMEDIDEFLNSIHQVKTPYKLSSGLILWNWVFLMNELEYSLRKAISSCQVRKNIGKIIEDIYKSLEMIERLINESWVMNLIDMYLREIIGCYGKPLEHLPQDLGILAMNVTDISNVSNSEIILDFVLGLHKELCEYCKRECKFMDIEDLIITDFGNAGPFVQRDSLRLWAEFLGKCGE